jgi:molybdate transport system substrate-binding protein
MTRTTMLLLTIFYLVSIASTARSETLHVAVADSMCGVMHKTGKAFFKQTGISITFTCKSSGLLFKGMRAGVIKADFYISANREWMNKTVNIGLIDQADITSPWGNKLIVAVLRQSTLEIRSLDDLASENIKKVIIGDPGKAPFGRYAKQTLENAGLWDQVKQKTASREKISLAIEMLEGESVSTVALLYASNLTQKLRTAFVIPTVGHDHIRYFTAPLKASVKNDALAQFTAFLRNRETSQLLAEAGFLVLDNDSVQ